MKDCEQCGKSFKPRKKTSRFCTRQCYKIKYNIKEKVIQRGNCEKCGVEHDGTYGTGRFCGTFCSRSFSGTKTEEIKKKISDTMRTMEDRKCIKCVKTFRPRKISSKFCSQNCGYESRSVYRPEMKENQTIECSDCKKIKPLKDFHDNSRGLTRYEKDYRCKECVYLFFYIRRVTGLDFVKCLLNSCRSSAIERSETRPECGVFELTEKDIEEMREEQNNRCKLSGVELEWVSNHFNKASIDRIDNDKGYTRDNVRLVTWPVNHGRYTWTDKQFIEMCRNVVEYNEE